MRKIGIIGLSALAALTLACGVGDNDTSSTVTGGDGQTAETAASSAPEKTTTTARVGQTITLTNDTFGEKTAVDITVANPSGTPRSPATSAVSQSTASTSCST